MSKHWSYCEVGFPNDIGSVSGCVLRNATEEVFEIEVPAGVVDAVIDGIKALQQPGTDPFSVSVSCFGGQHITRKRCSLIRYETGSSFFEATNMSFGESSHDQPHIFTFRCFDQE